MTNKNNLSNHPPEQPIPADLLAQYERRLAELEQEVALRRALNLEQQAELAALGTRYQQELADLHHRLEVTLAEQRAQFEKTLADQQALFAATLSDQTQRFESTIEATRSQYETRLSEQHDQYETRLAEQREQYETRLLEQHNRFSASLEALNRQMQAHLAEKEAALLARGAEIAALEGAVSTLRGERDAILNSNSWRLLSRIHRLRERIIPIGSQREKLMRALLRQPDRAIPAQTQSIPTVEAQPVEPTQPANDLPAAGEPAQVEETAIPSVENTAPPSPAPPEMALPIRVDEITPRQAPLLPDVRVEIVLRVPQPTTPEALRDCLSALLEYTPPQYHLTIVDPGGSPKTSTYLADFIQQFTQHAASQADPSVISCALVPSIDAPPGTSEFIILLNGTTLVTLGWLEGLLACAGSDDRIGMAGPLTNAPGLQSISLPPSDLGWAGSPLPAGISPAQVSAGLAATSARLYPRLPRLEQFCLLVRRSMIAEIGWLDPATPAQDYSQHAAAAGWQLALADDVYIYVRPEYTAAPSQPAGELPKQPVEVQPGFKETNRLLQGIQARAATLLERQALIRRGSEAYAGKRLLFILPMAAAGGGANLILLAARTLRRMGVEAHIFNLPAYRADFTRAYPDLDVPVIYAETSDLPQVASRYEAVVATSYITVYWAAQLAAAHPDIPIAYYIQDYEPYFDQPGSEGYTRAAASYTLLPGLVRCCTTPWIQETIQRQHQVPTTLLGPSLDVDLFLPRQRMWDTGDALRVAAMIRPSTPRRSPRLTMEILRRASQAFGRGFEPVIFGASLAELREAGLARDFPFKLAGRLNQSQVARLMNEVDIFLDYSIFQGLGLTALEAMACGGAAVVPQAGGTGTFARHEQNCLLVDTQDEAACYAALGRLLSDPPLRHQLGANGIATAAQFYPELPAYKLLQAIFPQ